MAETFLAIITAHLLGDFVLQSNRMIKYKKNFCVLFSHVSIVTMFSAIFLGLFNWQILSSILILHMMIDAIKINISDDSSSAFAIDQVVHILILTCLAYIFSDIASTGWWPSILDENLLNRYYATLCLISGVIVAVPAGGFLIGKLTSQFMKELDEKDISGLKKGGRYIGWLERSMVMLLLLIKQPAGIGFLFTAKSILRFGELKDASQRKVAEYIIIGTFLSFGWALLISVITQQTIQHWIPEKESTIQTIEVIINKQTEVENTD
ncbi:MAG: DUF3307 domain-containing protein [Thermodesulfobacteriota bacterium]